MTPPSGEEVARSWGIRYPYERREEQMVGFYAWLQGVKDQAVLDAAEALEDRVPYRYSSEDFNNGLDQAYEFLVNYVEKKGGSHG